ncbi:MAG: alpha/beta fold hydrolase [Nitrososphaerales archaeon]
MDAFVNGINVHYSDLGSKDDTVVLIHGFPLSSEMWNPQLKMLQENHRVIAYDIRGLGKSNLGDSQYTFEFFVDDLIGLLDHLKIPKVVLCGLSMGGYIALRAAQRNPERVAALVLCDTGPQADSNEAKLGRAASIKSVKMNGVKAFGEKFLKAVFAPASFESKLGRIDETRKVIEATSESGICGALLAMATRTDTTDGLTSIAVPTLIMVGELDKVTPPALSELMHARIKGSELHTILRAAHMSNLENEEDFNENLVRFLENLRI